MALSSMFAFMDEFGISRQSATWPLTVHGVMAHLAGLLVVLLQKKLPIYHIAIAGSFLNFSSLVAAAFVPNIIWMTVAMGIIGGEQDSVTKAAVELHTGLRAEKDNIEGTNNQFVTETLAQGDVTVDGAEDTFKRNHVINQATGPKAKLGKLFRNPLLYLFVVVFTVSEYIMNTFEITVLDYTLDKGSPRKEAEPVIMYIAAAELLGRLTLPLLWDCTKLRRSNLVAFCLTITAASLAVLPHVTEFGHVVAVVVITGCSCGCVVALKPVLMSDHLGVQMLPLCWGLAGVAMIPFAFGGPFLIGLFRDKMGSYDNLYRMMSALSIVFAAMLFTFVFFDKRAH
ncbi:hypothetical protein MTO96_003840 [Rhipicephalus appendiculatus]